MSDHFSGPAVMHDPSVDIADLYAFASPERYGHLVLIMDVFPMAPPHSFFSDAVTYRFRLRPLALFGDKFLPGPDEYAIDVNFDDLASPSSVQHAHLVTSDGRLPDFLVGETSEQNGIRVFAGLASDPFFMDVESAVRTELTGRLAFHKQGRNTVQFRDVLSMVVEIPIAPIIDRFHGVTLVGALAETLVPRFNRPIRIERVGRPEIKNFLLQSTMHDPHTKGFELRDLYNREDAFALSTEYRPLYETRLDANLAFFDSLDEHTAWPLEPDGRHPLRDLVIDDFLILDLGHEFMAGGFLEIERAMLEHRPHTSGGGRWLDDDIVDEMLTLYVNGGRGERLGDGVDGPSQPGSQSFPYVRTPNLRADLPSPAFLEH